MGRMAKVMFTDLKYLPRQYEIVLMYYGQDSRSH